MGSVEELCQALEEIKAELQSVKEENVVLKQKLGVRQFLTTPKMTPLVSSDLMDAQNGDGNETSTSKSFAHAVKKPSPFFVDGVKSIKVFNSLLAKDEIKPHEMKALGNGELKIILNSPDDYHKLQYNEKEIGPIKYQTYCLQEDKPFTVFI